jgi:hypothetical protein
VDVGDVVLASLISRMGIYNPSIQITISRSDEIYSFHRRVWFVTIGSYHSDDTPIAKKRSTRRRPRAITQYTIRPDDDPSQVQLIHPVTASRVVRHCRLGRKRTIAVESRDEAIRWGKFYTPRRHMQNVDSSENLTVHAFDRDSLTKLHRGSQNQTF